MRSPENVSAAPQRLGSLDAYRGLVMFLMMAEVLQLCRVAGGLPGNGFWSFLCHHQSHVEWVGCSLHDLIQPSFSFLVGVALPFSIASRAARGQSRVWMACHAWWRALVLVFLGIFLRSMGHSQTYFTFEDTLTQIGLGYGALFLLGFGSPRHQWFAVGLILAGYWLAFVWSPLPGAELDLTKVGVDADWQKEHWLGGLAAHWNKNVNLAWRFDLWFLNALPRETPFEFNGGGYATLSFVPTLATMILGLIAGQVIRADSAPGAKVKWLVTAGLTGLAAGWLLGLVGVCPVVKRIWTPAWTLFSGGWCFLLLAGFYLVIDVWNIRGWAFPLVVIGMNSIAAYCMDWMFVGFIRKALRTHLGPEAFGWFGAAYEPFVAGAAVLLTLWLILFWMYRRKLFLRI